MTETSLQSSARFCSSCGEPVVRDAVFCSACGRRVPQQDLPALGDSRPPAQLAGLVVLVGFLTVGLTLWVAVLAPGKAPSRVPLAQKAVEENVVPEVTGGGTLPANHPPLEIPADAKRYITELEEKANARPKDLAAWKTVAEVEYRAGQIDRGYLDKALTSFRHVLE